VGDSPASNTDDATTAAATAPSAPRDLKATASGQTAINLSWTAPSSNGGSAITGYKIEVSPNGTNNWTDLIANTNSVATTYSHTDLSPSTARHYRVRSINAVHTSVASNVATATTAAPNATRPSAPQTLVATASGQTAINLAWQAPASNGGSPLTGYRAQWSADGRDSWADVSPAHSGTGRSYSDTGLDPLTTRHYRVYAKNAVGESTSPSNTDDATTAATTAPSAPRTLVATASGRRAINLGWQAPASDGGSAITGYRIQWSADGRNPWTDMSPAHTGTGRTYSDTGLDPGATRHYRVYAKNSVGDSPASNTDDATTGAITAPGAPTDLSATAAGPTSITVTWTAPNNDGGAAITGYNIEVSPNWTSAWKELVANTASTATSYTHTGLTARVTRHYRVSAINSVETGSASSTASATTSAATAPGAPASLSATAAGPTSITLSWTAPTTTGGAPITGYKIEASSNGTSNWADLEANTASTATTYTHTGLTAAATRHYRVSAINSEGDGPASSTVNATTSAVTAPGAPTSLSATAAGTTSITLSWTPPKNTGGAAITGYKIEVSPNGTSDWADLEANTGTTVTTYTHSGLTASTIRHYRVRAINSVGAGSASTTARATTDASNATRPQAPTSLTASASGRTTINLSWQAPTDNGGSSITGYRVQWSADGNDPWTDVSPAHTGTGRTYSDTNLAPSTARHYRVYAINSVGESTSASNTDDATTDAVSAPSAPTALTATAQGSTIINLQWVAPLDDGGATITGYAIEVSLDGISSWATLVDNTNAATVSYSHTGLAAGVTRHYRVRAINAVDAGSASNIATATTTSATAPSAPTALSTTPAGPTRMDLSWTAPVDDGGAAITAYAIEVSPNGTSLWTNLETSTGSAATDYTHTDLTGATTYHYRVRAINAGGTGSPSNVASATTSASTVPDAPSLLTAVATSTTTMELSWSAPLNNGGAAIIGYNIESSPDQTPSSWSELITNTLETLTTYTDNTLQPNTTRSYRVRAINAVGPSSWSNVASAITRSSSSLAFSISSVPAQVYPMGRPIQELILPTATGGTPPYIYRLTPALPAGLTFDALTRTIGGTPTEITEPKSFTFSVEDANTDKVTLEFSIEVYTITFERQIANQVYVLSQVIEPLVLPIVTGGRDPIEYALTPLDSLPVGLRFDASTQTIRGTPEEIKAPVAFMYSAKDTNGAQDRLTFSIEVISPVSIQPETGLPQHFIVQTNYPNPFVHSTNLVVDLPWSAQIQVQVIDITGRRVYQSPPIMMTAGWAQQIEIKDLHLPSGVYVYHMTATSVEHHASSVYVGQFMRVQ